MTKVWKSSSIKWLAILSVIALAIVAVGALATIQQVGNSANADENADAVAVHFRSTEDQFFGLVEGAFFFDDEGTARSQDNPDKMPDILTNDEKPCEVGDKWEYVSEKDEYFVKIYQQQTTELRHKIKFFHNNGYSYEKLTIDGDDVSLGSTGILESEIKFTTNYTRLTSSVTVKTNSTLFAGITKNGGAQEQYVFNATYPINTPYSIDANNGKLTVGPYPDENEQAKTDYYDMYVHFPNVKCTGIVDDPPAEYGESIIHTSEASFSFNFKYDLAYPINGLYYDVDDLGNATIIDCVSNYEFGDFAIPEKIISPLTELYTFNVVAVGNGAMFSAENLESIYIPSSIQTIGARAFGGCLNLHRIEFETQGVKFVKDSDMSRDWFPTELMWIDDMGETVQAIPDDEDTINFKGPYEYDWEMECYIGLSNVFGRIVDNDGVSISDAKCTLWATGYDLYFEGYTNPYGIFELTDIPQGLFGLGPEYPYPEEENTLILYVEKDGYEKTEIYPDGLFTCATLDPITKSITGNVYIDEAYTINKWADDVIITTAVNSKGVMDINGGSRLPLAKAQLFTYNGSGAQKFSISQPNEDGYVTIKNTQSNLVLDVCGGSAYNGAEIVQFPASGNANQLWKVEKVGYRYVFRSALDENFVLDLNNSNTNNYAHITLWEDNGGTTNQMWLLLSTEPNVPGSIPLLDDGLYTISPLGYRNLALDVYGSSLDDEANITLFDKGVHQRNQVFRLTNLGYGYVTLTAQHSGKAIDVYTGNIIPGTNVQQFTYSPDNACQIWSIQYDYNTDSYKLINVASGLVMDVSGGKAYSGANIEAFVDHGGANQRFIFDRIG